MSKYQLLQKQGVSLISLSNAPVNSLNLKLRTSLVAGLEQAIKDKTRAVVIVGEGRMFSAGSDIKEFALRRYNSSPCLREVTEHLENIGVPVVAGMHGYALGGGMEIALASSHRVAASNTFLGFPEVQLGLLSAAGGTQRLPRLIGVKNSIDLLTTGKFIDPKTALSMGLIDSILDEKIDYEKFVNDAVDYAISEKVQNVDLSTRQVSKASVENSIPEEEWHAMATKINETSRGNVAPITIFNSIKASTSATFKEGCGVEDTYMNVLMNSPQSRALQYLFLSEKKTHVITDSFRSKKQNPKNTKEIKSTYPVSNTIDTVGVIGGGTMGAGIAMSCMNAGLPVILVETNAESATAAYNRIESTYKASSAYKSGKMSEATLKKLLSLVTPVSDMKELSDVDMVIEAVFENMEIKKGIFKQLDSICKEHAILATNTSYLDVDEIGSVTSRPQYVVGTHFFSPANVMKLVEIVKGDNSDINVVKACLNVAKRLSKVSVISGNCNGFIGNRMLKSYALEGTFLLEEGCTPKQIDSVLKSKVGLAMGLLEMFDLAGGDIGYRQREEQGLLDINTRPKDLKYSTLPDKLCASGFYGQKTGRGWYFYDPKSPRKPVENEDTLEIIKQHRIEQNISPRDISPEEIIERCLYPLINEGFKILEENIAMRPEDIDIVYTNGYGFPKVKGGPMYWAEREIGLTEVYSKLKIYSEKYPSQDYFKPCKLLCDLVESGASIREELYFRDHEELKFKK